MSEPIIISHERLLQLAEPFGELMNKMQIHNGDNISEIITAGLYALGVALAHMRVSIEVEDTISDGLLPLWTGYKDFIDVPVKTISRTIN